MKIVDVNNSLRPDLPNATLILGLGIAAICLVWWYGVIGFVLSITTLVLSRKSMLLFRLNPEQFDVSSYKRIVAGRIIAVIALIISIFAIVFAILIVLGVIGAVSIVSLTDLFI